MGGSFRRSRVGAGVRAALAIVMAASIVFSMTPMSAFGGWWRYAEPELISASPAGLPGDSWSEHPSISDDGMIVAFDSKAGNLSPDDMNVANDGNRDVFVKDRMGSMEILLAPEGAEEPDRGTRSPGVSGDGRYVAFVSGRDYIPTDDNAEQDLYLYDRETGEYIMAPTGPAGIGEYDDARAPQVSTDGSYVVFNLDWDLLPEDTNGHPDVYVWDVEADEITLVSETPLGATMPDRGARYFGMSADAGSIAFITRRDFDAADDNGDHDIYLWDMESGDITWLDVAEGNGFQGGWESYVTGEMSGDGKYLVFNTSSDILPGDDNTRQDVYCFDIDADTLELVSEPPAEADHTDRGSRGGTISDDGRYIAFLTGKDLVEEDTNGSQDLYLKDMDTGEFTRLAFQPFGAGAGDDVYDLTMSGDGNWLAFTWQPQSYQATNPGEVAVTVDPNGYEQVWVLYLGDAVAPGAKRLSGADRYATAVAVSKDAFPTGADTVVVATGANWPDALSASALAGAVGGPVLLTPSNTLPQTVLDEIDRLGARNAYIVGGTVAVSAMVEDQLFDALPGTIQRLAGADRYATSRAVANKVIELSGDTYTGMACVATGLNYPDALAAAPLAAGLEWPILLANPVTGDVAVPAATSSVAILGGTSAVSAAIETSLKTDLGSEEVTRVGGMTRYDTAAKVAAFGVDNGLMWDGVGIASGISYPDALAGGTMCGLQRSVMLLTPPTALDDYTEAALETHKTHIESVRFFGGTVALSSSVESAVKAILGL